MSAKPFVPQDAAIVRIAEAVRNSTGGLWDFGEEYHLLNRQPDFNYQALARAVKEQHDVDLYPPSVATKLRKAYEAFCVRCKYPLAKIKKYSPYYLYELSVVVDITPDNVKHWIERVDTTPRAELMDEVRDRGEGNGRREPLAMVRIPENVYSDMLNAVQHLSASVGSELSVTVFMEFVSELITNTQGARLRNLWDILHGESEAA